MKEGHDGRCDAVVMAAVGPVEGRSVGARAGVR